MIYSQAMFSAIVIYGCESWTIKKAGCQRIDAFKLWCLRRLLRVLRLLRSPCSPRVLDSHKSPLESKEIKPVNPKGNQPWIFTGRTDAEAEAPILWPSDAKSPLIGKDLDAEKD